MCIAFWSKRDQSMKYCCTCFADCKWICDENVVALNTIGLIPFVWFLPKVVEFVKYSGTIQKLGVDDTEQSNTLSLSSSMFGLSFCCNWVFFPRDLLANKKIDAVSLFRKTCGIYLSSFRMLVRLISNFDIKFFFNLLDINLGIEIEINDKKLH